MTEEFSSLISRIDDAIQDFKKGNILIVVDDADRENEGDLICSAETIIPEQINFMSKYGRGLICQAVTGERARALELDAMVNRNTASHSTDFTVSVDAIKDCTTGISAFDRANTIKTIIDENAVPEDLARPGHIFPIRAKKGGVLSRAGHTEATVDMARLAGHFPSGVLCEIMDEDGSMARMPVLTEFARKHNLKIITIADLIDYRRHNEKLIELDTTITLPTSYGDFQVNMYHSMVDDTHHLALFKGDIDSEKPTLVRMHSECLTGDILESLRCDCGFQLHQALKQIEEEGVGVVVYMRQEGRGIGLANKIRAYALQIDKGRDTVEANEDLGFKPDLRDYGVGAQILYDIGVRKIKLLTNNPRKIIALRGYGMEIVDRVPIECDPNGHNIKYLQTKKDKLGHMIFGKNEESL